MTKEKLIRKYNINPEYLKKLEDKYHYYLNNELIQRMKDIPMHRGSNCYLHSFRVAKMACNKSLKSFDKTNPLVVLEASILHDYYLYDWRLDKNLLKHHGTRHPAIANENAKKDFNISDEVSEIILGHMWPANFKKAPKNLDALIVVGCDKHVASFESLSSVAHKKKRMDKYMKGIAELFD